MKEGNKRRKKNKTKRNCSGLAWQLLLLSVGVKLEHLITGRIAGVSPLKLFSNSRREAVIPDYQCTGEEKMLKGQRAELVAVR